MKSTVDLKNLNAVIIGTGRVGKAIGYLLARKEINIIGVFNRSFEHSQQGVKFIGDGKALKKDELPEYIKKAQLVIITVPDDAIEKMSAKIRDWKDEEVYLLHMSGLHKAQLMNKEEKPGTNVFSLHPLQSVADAETGIKILPESVYTLEGDEKGVELGKRLAELLGVKYYFVESKYKPLYHAAAVFASNYLVTLLGISFSLLAEADLDNEDIRKGVYNLVKGTLSNTEKMGPEDALTGPVARGDRATIEAHRKSLLAMRPELLGIYDLLGKHTARLADKTDLFSLFAEGSGE